MIKSCESSGVGVLDKAVAILELIAESPRSLAELTTATAGSRATLHRLARALEQHAWLRRDDAGRFALGPRLAYLGRRADETTPLAALAHPALERLRDATRESVHLHVAEPSRGRRVGIAALDSPHGLRTIVELGATLPLNRCSAGRVLGGEAASASASASAWVESPWVESGWVESVEEREVGVASVSAPVRGAGGDVLAAVGVSGPIERTSRRPGERYGEAVRRAAAEIEAAVGTGSA